MLTNIKRLSIPQEEYFQLPGYSSTDFRALIKAGLNPLRYREETSPTESSAMLIGSAFDCALLEPQLFPARYTSLPEAAATPTTALQAAFAREVASGADAVTAYATAGYSSPTEAKAQKLLDELSAYIAAAGSGKKVLSYEEKGRVDQMLAAATGHASINDIVCGESQAVFTGEFTCQYGLIPVKGMLDSLNGDVVTDVKTTGDWSSLKANFFRRGYDVQLALYRYLSGARIAIVFYQESVEPYRNKLVDVTPYVNAAEEKLDDAMLRMCYAHNTGNWLHAMEYYEGGYEPF